MADITMLRARNADFWAGAAPGWVQHADWQDRFGRPLGAPAMDWLDVGVGERVLDVGCGTGGTTAELAAKAGLAVGVDLSPAMVAACQQRVPGIRFLVSDVDSAESVQGGPYDAAFSRMALMLFADPVAGCSAIARSLRPGGRLAATVFRDAAASPWLPAVMLGAAAHVGPMPPMPLADEPGPFAFADPARAERVLSAAGFTGVRVTPHDVALQPPDEPDAVARWLIEVGPAGAAYRAASPAAQAAARAGAVGLLARFRTAGEGYRLPAGIWLLTATV